MELFDDILKIDLIPNYSSIIYFVIVRNYKTNVFKICEYRLKNLVFRSF